MMVNRESNVIRHMDKNLKIWDLLIILFAIYNSLFLPLELAFRPDSLKSFWMTFTNHCIDGCFFIDIILSFNTSYIHGMTGEEIFDRKSIAANYISG
jgi:hypothetical protein